MFKDTCGREFCCGAEKGDLIFGVMVCLGCQDGFKGQLVELSMGHALLKKEGYGESFWYTEATEKARGQLDTVSWVPIGTERPFPGILCPTIWFQENGS